MYFKGSLRGLSPGAAVDLRGINIGEVKNLSRRIRSVCRCAAISRGGGHFPATYPRALALQHPPDADDTSDGSRALIDSMVAHGMRAEIKSGNLLTGQKFVAVDVQTDVASRARGTGTNARPYSRQATGALDEIQDSDRQYCQKAR